MEKAKLDITLRNGIIMRDVPIAKITVRREAPENSMDTEIKLGNRHLLERIEKVVNRIMD